MGASLYWEKKEKLPRTVVYSAGLANFCWLRSFVDARPGHGARSPSKASSTAGEGDPTVAAAGAADKLSVCVRPLSYVKKANIKDWSQWNGKSSLRRP